ncbi:hypothetical protein [Halomonas binhaiensis]|uniref:DUF4156 domain-containing protein n=1 Tax=Halomonas binhaiensis TaxID=2562282 RepID=A0A5C1NIS8_9GAMM|nr:hypothetical protein [Halomonas binhaiensis]QEM82661.1 hypothetical protein E4T21_14720 [Halomonas binhaiensis]
MRKLIPVSLAAAVVTALVSGCTYTSSQMIAPHKYKAVSSGSIANSKEQHLKNIRDEAQEVCGDSNYTLEGSKDDAYLRYTPTMVGPTPVTELELIFECH